MMLLDYAIPKGVKNPIDAKINQNEQRYGSSAISVPIRTVGFHQIKQTRTKEMQK